MKTKDIQQRLPRLGGNQRGREEEEKGKRKKEKREGSREKEREE